MEVSASSSGDPEAHPGGGGRRQGPAWGLEADQSSAHFTGRFTADGPWFGEDFQATEWRQVELNLSPDGGARQAAVWVGTRGRGGNQT